MKEKPDIRTQRHAERQIRKDLFISGLALVSVAIGLYDLNRGRTGTGFTWYDILDLVIVAIFIVDFIWSAIGSGDWKAYIRKYWYEIPSMLPITGNMIVGAEAIPLLRSLRLVRLLRVIRLMRVIGAATRLRNFWRTAFRIARRAHLTSMLAFALMVIAAGAGVAWIVEAEVNSNFANFGDTLWWAVNMFTNVAYVEFHPATLGGRMIAMVLEFTGIGFIGLFTASLAGALLTDKEEEEEDLPPLE